MEKESVLRMIDGAIEERVDYEVGRLLDNVLDLNTKPTAKRTITITLEFSPDETRNVMSLNATVKTKLAATEAVKTTLSITADPRNGEVIVSEVGKQVPGQLSMQGEEQPQPKLLAFAK